jgi:cell division protein FtsW (lipid II flippase)
MTFESNAQTRPVTVGEWFIAILVLAIPLVGLVMYFYWGFAEGVNENKRNFCRASLLWAAIGIGLAILVVMMGGMAMFLGNSG